MGSVRSLMCGARDEGLPFVAYPAGAASRRSGQGCAKRTAEGGLALSAQPALGARGRSDVAFGDA